MIEKDEWVLSNQPKHSEHIGELYGDHISLRFVADCIASLTAQTLQFLSRTIQMTGGI